MNGIQSNQRSDPRLLLSGLDSLYVGYYVDTVCSDLDFEELEYQKVLRREDRSLEFEPIMVGSREFLLRSYGPHPYKYVLSCENWELKLTEHMLPNIYVQYRSKALWLHGYKALHAELLDWFASLKLRVIRCETVSRADWSFDFHLTHVDFDIEHFVSRAKKDCTWRENKGVQTFQFGTTSTLVRIYDKVTEIKQQSNKNWFFQLWGQSEDVWRVEVQVRSERLKKGGIKSIEDLDCLAGDLLREILSGHTTLRTPTKDPNRSRWPLAPLWRELLAAIGDLPQTGLVEAYDPEQDFDWRIAKMLQSTYGNLKQLGALLAIRTNRRLDLTFDELCEDLPEYMDELQIGLDWRQELERRIKALELGR